MLETNIDQLNSSMNTQLPLFYSSNDGEYSEVSNTAIEISQPSKAALKLLYTTKKSQKKMHTFLKMLDKSLCVGPIKKR